MRYLQRNDAGKVVGHFANPQPGYAEEEVADDHPDIVAWQAEREAEVEDAAREPARLEKRVEALEAKLKAK